MNNPHLELIAAEDVWEVRFGEKTPCFPRSDVIELPINSSAETLGGIHLAVMNLKLSLTRPMDTTRAYIMRSW